MNGRKPGVIEQGGGQGQRKGRMGQVGQGRGRFGGPISGSTGGTCVCPKCGNREPHERGVPCLQKQCPKCSTAMIRE